MQDLDEEALLSIGLTRPIRQLLKTLPLDPHTRPVRVTALHPQAVSAHDGRDVLQARLLPVLARELAAAGDALAVGDWALARRQPDGSCMLTDFFARSSALGRGPALRQVVVSNVDTALVMTPAGADLQPASHRLQRLLARLQAGGVKPVLLQAGSPELTLRLAACLRPGRTLVALWAPQAGRAPRPVAAAGALQRLPGGACLLDAPGLQALAEEESGGLGTCERNTRPRSTCPDAPARRCTCSP